jgi:hypothetical protein
MVPSYHRTMVYILFGLAPETAGTISVVQPAAVVRNIVSGPRIVI